MQPATKHILCVDDDEDTCFMLAALLKQENFETTAAGNMSEALRLVESVDFDLFILDRRLSDGTGLEVCGRLKRLFPEVPLIFFTGDGDELERAEALQAGANAFVKKPDIDKLVAAVHRLLATDARATSADGQR